MAKRKSKKKGSQAKNQKRTVQVKSNKPIIIVGIVVLVFVLMVIGIVMVITSPKPSDKNNPTATAGPTVDPVVYGTAEPNTQKVKVEFVMADGGKMDFDLYPKYAPKTVENFVKLANEKFYDGLKFHRIMKTFMVQGGDGSNDPSKPKIQSIFGEFPANGFIQNTLGHVYGAIAMAKTPDPNSATSQFYIVSGDAKGLNGGYAVFGQMTSGKATLDKIASWPVDPSGEGSTPIGDVVIKSVRVIG